MVDQPTAQKMESAEVTPPASGSQAPQVIEMVPGRGREAELDQQLQLQRMISGEARGAIRAWTTPAGCKKIQDFRRGASFATEVDEEEARSLDRLLYQSLLQLDNVARRSTLHRGMTEWPEERFGAYVETGYMSFSSAGMPVRRKILMVVPAKSQNSFGAAII